MFEFGNVDDAVLVGAQLMYNLEGWGWCRGESKEQNKDGQRRISGVKSNFIVHYETDGSHQDSWHTLEPDRYAADANAGLGAWILIKPSSQLPSICATDFTKITGTDFVPPSGYQTQKDPPSSERCTKI